MIEALIVSLPLILIALARLVEAAAVVILARRRDAPLALADGGGGRRLKLRAAFRRAAAGSAMTRPHEDPLRLDDQPEAESEGGSTRA